MEIQGNKDITVQDYTRVESDNVESENPEPDNVESEKVESENVESENVEYTFSENVTVHSVKKQVKPAEFDTLVLSGGSIHGIIMLGSLQYLEDNYLLKHVKIYVGTSAGSMCGYLLAIGYTPIEIMVYLCTKQMLEKMRNFNVVAMINGSGATSFSHIHEQLEKMTIEKIGQLITLGDLYKNYGKKLYCITHNMTSDMLEVLSYETYPDMPCLIALRMSSNLPFIFDHFKYLGSYYIDGGLSNNFPIDIGHEKGTKILGLAMYDMHMNFSENKDSMIEYIYKLMSIPIKQQVLNNIETISDKCTVVHLQPDKTPFFDFNLNTRTKLEMFSNGFKQMKIFWEL